MANRRDTFASDGESVTANERRIHAASTSMKASKVMSAVNPLHGSDPMQFKPPAVEQRAYEPSMEEILASIRRIIADDQSLPNRALPAEGLEAHAATVGEHPVQAPPVNQPPEPSQAPRVVQAPQSAPSYQSGQPRDAFTGAPASVTMLHQVLQGRRAEASGTDPAPAETGHDVQSEQRDMLEHGHIAAPQFVSPAGPIPHQPEHAEAYADSSEADVDDDRSPEDEKDASALFSSETDRTVTGAFNTLAATRLADNSEDLLGLAREMIRPLLKSWLDDNLPGMVERMVRAEIERVARGGR